MSPPPFGWLPPRCESRIGAAHQRRWIPCQDASGVWCFADAEGVPLQALVVSDGHGGSRYDRSEVGSAFACRVALEEIESQLRQTPIGRGSDVDAWRQWLANGLPSSLVRSWRREVLSHGQTHPRADGAPPSVIPYGATVGVILLTPKWWGYTGLGDWDLVRTDSAGGAELLSEEPDSPGGGEATFSLCMQGAENHFSSRSGLVSIDAGEEAFALVLSTDGIRKSCSSDTDFLNLARHLGGLSAADDRGQPSALAEALDHISAQGSGDDVSVAIARWGQLRQNPLEQGPEPTGKPVIVQPASQRDLTETTLLGPPENEHARAEPSLEKVVQGGRRLSTWAVLLMGSLALLVAGAGAMALLGWQPFARRERVPQGPGPMLIPAVVHEAASELCRPNQNRALLEKINDTFIQRRSTFKELLNHSKQAQFPNTPSQDPTGTLIAWSRTYLGIPPEAGTIFCPELRLALSQQWQQVLRESSPPPPLTGGKKLQSVDALTPAPEGGVEGGDVQADSPNR
jgi:hypothetical protein